MGFFRLFLAPTLPLAPVKQGLKPAPSKNLALNPSAGISAQLFGPFGDASVPEPLIPPYFVIVLCNRID
jgi:hypothetical protein